MNQEEAGVFLIFGILISVIFSVCIKTSMYRFITNYNAKMCNKNSNQVEPEPMMELNL